MNIALFGGTFDPIHRGHLAVARAAAARFHLDQILFIPAPRPPHKTGKKITSFCHRYAMLALATAPDKRFLPSPIESEMKPSGPSYSITTIRKVRRTIKKTDRLFFITGIDSFAGIARWHQAQRVLEECEFIVVSRPGYSLGGVARFLPEGLRKNRAVEINGLPGRRSGIRRKTKAAARDGKDAPVRIHLLTGVEEPASATAIRAAAAAGKPIERWTPPAVAAYITKLNLYR